MRIDWPKIANKSAITASIGLAISFVLVRVQMGLNLTDEAYYAVAPVSWIRCWPERTGNLSIHQFSGCITYPFILIYGFLLPDLTGIVLALRFLYFCGSIITSVTIFTFLKPIIGLYGAIISALIMLFFIPYGIPAPSYNTIGSQMGITALSLLLMALRNSDEKKTESSRIIPMLSVSAFCMALSIIAYPILAGMFAVTVVFILSSSRNSKSTTVTWAVLVLIISLVLGLCAIVWLGGSSRIAQMIVFMGSFETAPSIFGKLMCGLNQLGHNSTFLILFITGIFSGFAGVFSGGYLRRGLQTLWVAGTVYWCLVTTNQPVLFGKTHDLVFLHVANSIPKALIALYHSDFDEKLVATLFFSSLMGALLISYAATHALFSFSVMGIGSAVSGLALQFKSAKLKQPRLAFLSLASCCFLFGYLSLRLVYGENWPNEPLRIRIMSGPFAGLLATDRSNLSLESGVEAIKAIPPWCESVELIGPSGYYLLTNLELRSAFPFPLIDHLSQKTYPLLQQWYENSANIPDSVVLVSPYAIPMVQTNLFQKKFVQNNFRIVTKTDNGILVFVNPNREP